MTHKALVVGINDYPGTEQDLGGCVNDAKAWATLLTAHYAFPEGNIRLLLDAQATKAAMLSGLDWLVEGARPGDVLVFAYSGHGTWVPDQGETDEQDGRDEALCPYDLGEDFSNLLVDDELRARVRQVPRAVQLTMIADSCFSGTVSRAFHGGVRPAHPVHGRADAAPRIKYLPPPKAFERAIRAPSRAIHPWGPVKKRLAVSQGQLQEILLAGASSTQFSYDALIGGKRHGAFTYYALQTVKAANYQLTYLDLIRGVLQRLPFNLYPQTPQLEGSRTNKRRPVFAPLGAGRTAVPIRGDHRRTAR